MISKIFKRKLPKRSAWMRGLLWAEKMYQENRSGDVVCLLRASFFEPSIETDFARGVADYVHHHNETNHNYIMG